MKLFKGLCYVIGVGQLALGLIYLFVPQAFIGWQGLSPIEADIGYPFSMLAGRFIVYGVGMFVIANDPDKNRFWLYGMIAIQAFDLAGGLYYTLSGSVALEHSAFPMFNATWIMVGLYLLRNSSMKDSKV
jgi:hypothetical protein